MKIAYLNLQLGNISGFSKVVSSHVQVPLKQLKEVSKTHDVILVTNRIQGSQIKPENFPPEASVHYISDSVERSNLPVMLTGKKSKISVYNLYKQLLDIYKIIKDQKIQVFHSFGSVKVIALVTFLSFFLKNVRFIHTINFVNNIWYLNLFNFLINKSFSHIITSTEFMQKELSTVNIKSVVIKHGLRSNFKYTKNKKKNRVIFWRDPSYENGFDIIEKIFLELSPKFKNLTFTLALRPHYDNILDYNKFTGIDNIEIYEFPYKNNITIEQLLGESLIAVLPFKNLSTNPQLAVLETMQAGVPLFTTNIESNSDLIKHFQTGFLYSLDEFNDISFITAQISKVLCNPELMSSIAELSNFYVNNNWSWNIEIKKLVELYDK